MKTQNKILCGMILAIAMVLVMITMASALVIDSVSVSPSTIAPGKTAALTIDLNNNEDSKITDITVSLDLSAVPFSPGTSSEASLDEIRKGNTDSVEFDLVADASAAAGTYKIPATITYTINSTVNTKKMFFSLTVNAKPVLGLSTESVLIAGQKNQLQIQITNTGLAKAGFLQIQIGPGNYNLLSSDTVYIGDLNSNDFDTGTFSMFTSAAGTISVPVTMTYKDSANNDYTETSSLQVRVYSQAEAVKLGLITKSNTGTYVVVIVLLVVLWFVYSRLRRWMKKRKANNSGGK